jgi:hypothetical protein
MTKKTAATSIAAFLTIFTAVLATGGNRRGTVCCRRGVRSCPRR